MRAVTRAISAFAVLAGVTAGTLGLSAGAAHAARANGPRTDDCVTHLDPGHTGSVVLTGSPVAGSEVLPGSEVTITARWNEEDWEELNKILVCVITDGSFSSALSGGEKPADNDGELVWTLDIPAAAPSGTELCVRGVVFGQSRVSMSTQQSEFACFRVAAAAASTTTTTTAPPPPPAEEDPKVQIASPVGGAGDPGPAMAVAPEEQPAQVEPQVLAELPRTGSAPASLLLASGAAILLGGVALTLGSRKAAPGPR